MRFACARTPMSSTSTSMPRPKPVWSLAASAQRVIVNNQTDYYDGGNYHPACPQGADSAYCVVPNPPQEPQRGLVQGPGPPESRAVDRRISNFGEAALGGNHLWRLPRPFDNPEAGN